MSLKLSFCNGILKEILFKKDLKILFNICIAQRALQSTFDILILISHYKIIIMLSSNVLQKRTFASKVTKTERNF